MNQLTAILFFSRSAKAEVVEKPFHTTVLSDDLKIKTALISHTLTAIKKTNFPYYFFDEKMQTVKSFGEKISNAFEFIFNKGFKRVIAIGNDCAGLQAKHIINAAERLSHKQIIYGMDNHGGAYLIGVCKETFNKNDFKSMRWQTKYLFQDLKEIPCSEMLPELLIDINNATDAKKSIRLFSHTNILVCILNNAWRVIYYLYKLLHRFSSFYTSRYFSLRAPPAIF